MAEHAKPKKKKMPIKVQFAPDILARIRAAAERQDRSMSWYARRAILDRVEAEETATK